MGAQMIFLRHPGTWSKGVLSMLLLEGSARGRRCDGSQTSVVLAVGGGQVGPGPRE